MNLHIPRSTLADICIVVGSIVIIVGSFVWFATASVQEAQGDGSHAQAAGMDWLSKQCEKESLGSELCMHMLGSVGTQQYCDDYNCWSVYAHVDDPYGFGAIVTVRYRNGQYEVINYLRDVLVKD